MDLAWLLRDVSPKPESHARERDAEETTQGEGQQRCSPSQVEAGWSRSFHQSDRSFRRPSRSSQGASHLCQDLAGCPAIGFGLIPESIMPLGGGSRPGLACCPQVIGRGEEAGEGDSCLSGGAAVCMPIRTRAEVDRFLAWMKAEGLSASTQSSIISTIRSVQPGNEPLRLIQVKVPAIQYRRRS